MPRETHPKNISKQKGNNEPNQVLHCQKEKIKRFTMFVANVPKITQVILNRMTFPKSK